MSSKQIFRPSAFLIDLSGTVHIENSAIPGAVEAVKKLRQTQTPFMFVTNTTKESQNKLWERLSQMGFDVAKEEIFSSLTAARSLIVAQRLRPMLMLDPRALEDFSGMDTSDPNAVVVGLAPEMFNYEEMTKAFRLIKDHNAPLIAINKSRYFASNEGLLLGAGCFVSGLEYSADVKAKIVGKPDNSFFKSSLESLGKKSNRILSPKDTVMIGDDVRDDVLGAQSAGFKGCLVKTGKYAQGDEEKFGDKPNFIFDSFTQAVTYWTE